MTPSSPDEIRFTVPGEPKGKGRPRATSINGMTRMYTPKTTKDGEAEVRSAALAAMAGMSPITGPVSVSIQIKHAIRKSWTKAKRQAALLNEIVPTIKSDMDNVLKLYFDALNGVAWIDDVQVVNVIASKRFSESPRVDVRIIPIATGSA